VSSTRTAASPAKRPARESAGKAAAGRGNPWRGRDLLGLHGISAADLRAILVKARELEPVANKPDTRTGALAGRTVVTMFFEDSTRTRTSFTLAARRMSAEVEDLSIVTSSVNKGETLIDTARTIEAMGVSAMVVRARQNGAAAMIADAVACPVLNAGDGRHEHPTQGLLDIYTVAEAHGRLADFDLSGLTVAIVGDVASSRVARSAIAGVTTLGAKVVCVGPPALAPRSLESLGCAVAHEFDPVLAMADAVMMLRIQFERHGDGTKEGAEGKAASKNAAIPSIREYRELFGMTEERASRIKGKGIIMHPGPMNRGIEIDSAAADGARSVVLRQVAHGVAVRMAAMGLILGS
jgi:aspartate carbamoyltransferase catalytic subunit